MLLFGAPVVASCGIAGIPIELLSVATVPLLATMARPDALQVTTVFMLPVSIDPLPAVTVSATDPL